ncbi:MAG: molybdopterin-dependent oxidoreductase [Syntrophorhabdaceae bacterium]|nr:molybdopterin-dependent oxidoreductase [Syntrophorhabdaceae bacterium]
MAGNPIRSICGFCHTNCGVKIHLKEGRISRIEGDEEHPVNRGYICPKAQAIKPLLESEERLKYPMIKTKGGFKRVSWDEALDYAAERLTKIRDTYGPETVFHGHGAPVTYGARDGFIQFMGLFGSPNYTGVANTCFVPRLVAFMQAFGGRPEPDFEKTNLVIFWGSNPANTTRFSSYAAYDGFNRIIPDLKKRGVKVIVIDPVKSESVSFADEWIRPNMATDCALGLAMAHTIIEEGLYDKDFVEKWVLRFDEIKASLKAMTPEWAERITSVHKERIRGLAREYAMAEGGIILDGNGLDMHTNGVQMVRAITLLIALTGNIDRPGGSVFYSVVPQRTLPTTRPEKKRMAKEEFPLFPQVPFPAFKEALLGNGEDRPRGLIVHHSNPVLVQANRKRTEEAFARLDFLMVIDVFPTATTQLADLILPAAADFEALDYRAYSSSKGGFLALREKVCEPAGEARSVFTIEYELAKKMGMEREYPFTNDEEWIDFVLKPAGVTVEDLREKGIIYASPPVEYRKYEREGFKTPSKRIECYSKRFESAGYGVLPLYEEPRESHTSRPQLAGEYPLIGTTRRPAEFVHTKLINLEVTRRRYPEPYAIIHYEDGYRKGINDNDMVEVASPRGKITVRAKLTDTIGPGLISIDFGWGNPTDGLPSVNTLTDDSVWDRVSGGYPNRMFICEVKKV